MKRHDFESEFFGKVEFDKLKKIAEEKHAKVEQEEREKLKKLHHMHCPKCGMEIHSIYVKEFCVDKCFCCQGAWLDAESLDKLLGKESHVMERILSLLKLK
jgi:hypothetical protein